MFERTLEALIKGLRSHRGQDEAAFVTTLLDEIRQELRSGDMDVKAGAVLKLTYLQMLGYPFSNNASFPILEVMASPQYHLKQVGYLAATRSFTQDTEVLILATNLVKKDLHSPNPLEVAVALNGLSHIVTPELAQHLAADIVGIMNHSRPAIRKKAILCLFNIIQYHPPALDQSWHRLQEKLADSDPGVVSAAVNIICELARRDPKPFVALSPQLFDLLTSSTNNWMLIKIVKLFGALTPHEPRLVRKLLPPIKTLISTTPAMSLLYESIHSVISGEMLDAPGGDELAQVCTDKLAAFLDDEDRNLRYIALLALVRILPTHPHLVAQYQHLILPSIDDPDLSIRLRTLDLVAGMASRRNLRDIIEQLMAHLEPRADKGRDGSASASSATASLRQALAGGGAAQSAPAPSAPATASASYRLEISRRILFIGASDTFANIADFEWYLSTLLRLARIARVAPLGRAISDQILEITLRVRAVRPHAVSECLALLEDEAFLLHSPHADADTREVLRAASWVCSEYAGEAEAEEGHAVENPRVVVPLLLRPALLDTCSPATAAASIHAGVKLFAHWAAGLSRDWDPARLPEVRNMADLVAERLEHFASHADPEVSERASQFLQLFVLLQRDLEAASAASSANEVSTASTANQASTDAGAAAAATAPSPAPDGATQEWASPSPSASPTPSAARPHGPKSLHLLAPLFSPSPLGPVGEKAQSKVARPREVDLGLDLAAVGMEGWEVAGASSARGKAGAKTKGKTKGKGKLVDVGAEEEGEDEEEARLARARRKAEREERMRNDPFYIFSSSGGGDADPDASGGSGDRRGKKSKGKGKAKTKHAAAADGIDDDDDFNEEDVPIVRLSLADLGLQPTEGSTTTGRKAGRSKDVDAAADAAAEAEKRLRQEEEEMPDDEGDGQDQTEAVAGVEAPKEEGKEGQPIDPASAPATASAVAAVEEAGGAEKVKKKKKTKTKDAGTGTGTGTSTKKKKARAAAAVID